MVLLMAEDFMLLALEICSCIPNCKECPGKWINKVINHEIVCRCCKNGHIEITPGDSDFVRQDRQTETKPSFEHSVGHVYDNG